jgi:hypothetical protein
MMARGSRGSRRSIEDAKIAACVDHAARNAELPEDLDRAIDRKTLGDPAEIDPDAGAVKANRIGGVQCDRAATACRKQGRRPIIAARQQSKPLERGSNRDVEHAVRSFVQLDRQSQNFECPRVDRNGSSRCLAIEAGNVAVRIVKAHQPVRLGYGCKRRLDRRLGVGPAGKNRQLDERAEQRSCAAHAIGHGCHRPPRFFSRLR